MTGVRCTVLEYNIPPALRTGTAMCPSTSYHTVLRVALLGANQPRPTTNATSYRALFDTPYFWSLPSDDLNKYGSLWYDSRNEMWSVHRAFLIDGGMAETEEESRQRVTGLRWDRDVTAAVAAAVLVPIVMLCFL